MRKYYVTSESVTEGHPDKICDQVSDAILDAIIAQDPKARVACETTCTTGIINIMGEITTSAYVDIPKIARDLVLDIGYDSSDKGFDGHTCAVSTMIDEQSSDIAMGVDHSPFADNKDFDMDTGAGDQGMMYGYACDETPEFMPLPISIAHALTKKLTEVRKNGTLEYLRPDGKSQVTIEYIDGKPNKIDTIVVSTQHSDEISIEELRQDVYDEVIMPVLYNYPNMVDVDGFECYINPTGRFVIGGPHGDSGLTGRKIVVDTYGGVGRVGGGCLSGKDPTKVDRSAAYAARWVAKNVVGAGLASKCEVQISYAIGVAAPTSIYVDTFGTNTEEESLIEQAVLRTFDLRPGAIIKRLDLRQPIYRELAAYGQMGREDLNVPWEKVDMDEQLLYNLNLLKEESC